MVKKLFHMVPLSSIQAKSSVRCTECGALVELVKTTEGDIGLVCSCLDAVLLDDGKELPDSW